MGLKHFAASITACLLCGPAFADCQMAKLGTLPLEADTIRPYIQGQINGQDMYILADTGAEISLVWGGAAARVGLKPVHVNARLIGLSGEEPMQAAVIEELKLGDYVVRKKRWPVFGDREATDDSFGMILGSDFFKKMDIEIDLANQKIILWEPRDCRKAALAYWSKDFMLAELKSSNEDRIETDVIINGRKVRALLDTGATFSLISTGLAHALGVDEQAPDSEAGPQLSGMVGNDEGVPSYIGRFDTFEMGDLSVKNARLVVGELDPRDAQAETGSRIKGRTEIAPDVIIGADFFHANHVLVARSQGYIYFTYNGGTIFRVDEVLQD